MVTVSVYVVVVAGETVADAPVTGIAPGLIKPVPLANEAVSVTVPPAVMVAALGAKLKIEGTANTLMFAVPSMEPDLAVTVAAPGVCPTAKLLVISATAGAEDDHVTDADAVTSLVVPSV